MKPGYGHFVEQLPGTIHSAPLGVGIHERRWDILSPMTSQSPQRDCVCDPSQGDIPEVHGFNSTFQQRYCCIAFQLRAGLSLANKNHRHFLSVGNQIYIIFAFFFLRYMGVSPCPLNLSLAKERTSPKYCWITFCSNRIIWDSNCNRSIVHVPLYIPRQIPPVEINPRIRSQHVLGFRN